MTLIPTKRERKRWLKKTKHILGQPVTIGHIVLVLLTLLVAFLTIGAAPPSKASYVAHAASLRPEPIVSQSPQPIVKETVVPYTPPASEPVAPIVASSSADGLLGSLGYARAGGNCVNEPGVNKGEGNPSSWPVTSKNPWIGATVVFTWNHTGVITGIWSNGDVEVRHQNFWGGQHRFPQSMIRGYR